MSYRDPTYVIFDGDTDQWAYRFMRGWRANSRLDFDFRDAHDIGPMTARAQDERYVKDQLTKRMAASAAVLVLVGERTKWLYKFVRWELELALDLDLAIIAVSLANKRMPNLQLIPPIICDRCFLNVTFQMRIIQFALDHFPPAFRRFSSATRAEGGRFYNDEIYRSVGL